MPKNFIVTYDREDMPIFDRHFKKENIGFRTKNSNYFKSIMGFISTIIEQINLKFYNDGIYISSLDNSHISLVECFIPKKFFNNYNISENILVGLNLNVFMKILSRINNNDELIISIEDDSINMSFINLKYQKHYSIKQMNIESDEIDIQPMENPTKIKIISKYFNEIINDLADIGENVNIIVKETDDNDENITFITESDISQLNLILHNEDIVCKNLKNLNIEFSLKNLQLFSKGYSLNNDMEIEITIDAPLKLSYKIIGNGFINYYIAPKMED